MRDNVFRFRSDKGLVFGIIRLESAVQGEINPLRKKDSSPEHGYDSCVCGIEHGHLPAHGFPKFYMSLCK